MVINEEFFNSIKQKLLMINDKCMTNKKSLTTKIFE